MPLKITDSYESLIVNALNVAAQEYDQHAKDSHALPRLAEQFERQAIDARTLADAIQRVGLTDDAPAQNTPAQTPKPLYVALARAVGAYHRCCEPSANAGQASWAPKHRARIELLVKNHMPRGSVVESGTTLDLDASTEEKLIFHTAFHHMNDQGSYDGWTDHQVTVRPSLAFAFTLSISGRDRSDIKDGIHAAFEVALKAEVTEYPPE